MHSLNDNHIYRKEYFGYTKYNKQSLSHEFIREIDHDNAEIIDIGSEKCINDGLLVAPIRVYVETTLKCNLTCNYCLST